MMNQQECAALDRHITGNYGEDQLKEMPKAEPDVCPPPPYDITQETWRVNPRGYTSGNVYTVWNENDNYPDDLTPEAMDARAQLMAQAPEMFRILEKIVAKVYAAPTIPYPEALCRWIASEAEAAIRKVRGGE